MLGSTDITNRTDRVWLSPEAGTLEAFHIQVARETHATDWPHAARIEENVPIYSGESIRELTADRDTRRALMAEWFDVLSTGPGCLAISGAYADTIPIDRATAVFEEMIEEQRRSNNGGGDHFAKPGANDRIWNALEKHCLADPQGFALYYANLPVALVSETWLGPAYQMTAQVNRVNPGGAAQSAHRDFHLGFMTPEQITRYPAHIHGLSPALTLQGGIAHSDMPVESGPTRLLPYSQIYREGYLAFGRPEFQAYFAENAVQLPLKKGDAVFFNPALMHAAGENRSSDILRMVNLLQVSSAFGRAMEAVNRSAMGVVLEPVLQDLLAAGTLTKDETACAIAACAEGYPFPTDLDTNPPVGGLAPKSQADKMRERVLGEAFYSPPRC